MRFYLSRRLKFIANYNQPQGGKPKFVKDDGDIVNERIRFEEVRLIGPVGEQLGTMSSREALKIAEEYGLDLLCVSPKAVPPVCKILNYGKFKFDKQKQDKENRKNSKKNVIELKEIQLTPQIGDHDLMTKVKASIKFLENGDKLKVGVRFKGRQMAHTEIGLEVLNKFLDYVKEYGTVDKEPVLDGRWYSCTVSSKTKK